MKFTPSYTLNIIEDADFADRMDEICRQLANYRVSGDLICRDGMHLFYEYFLTEGAKGSVVMLHGMSEFTRKHYEFAWYLLEQGYNVFMYDQRGHGFSGRITEQLDLLHVDRFSDFVEDLQEFVQKIVVPVADTPLYLYGHSMGGAVCLLHLAAYPDTFRRAVVCSPLFEPQAPVPTPLVALSAWTDKILRGDKSRMSHSRDFVPQMPEQWEKNPACSRNKYMMQLRIDNPEYQSTPMTAGFTLRVLYLTPRLLRNAKKIKTPHLLISGTADTVVKTKPHARYAKKATLCEYVSIPNAQHAMMCDDQPNAAIHAHLVLDFLKEDPA